MCLCCFINNQNLTIASRLLWLSKSSFNATPLLLLVFV